MIYPGSSNVPKNDSESSVCSCFRVSEAISAPTLAPILPGAIVRDPAGGAAKEWLRILQGRRNKAQTTKVECVYDAYMYTLQTAVTPSTSVTCRIGTGVDAVNTLVLICSGAGALAVIVTVPGAEQVTSPVDQ